MSALEKKRWAIIRRYCGDELDLESAALDHVPLLRGDDVVAELYGFAGDAALLFAPGSTTILGHAIQHGFLCRDRALWEAMAAIPHGELAELRAILDYSVEEDIDDPQMQAELASEFRMYARFEAAAEAVEG